MLFSVSILSAALMVTPSFEDITTSVGLSSVRFASGILPSTAASAWTDLDGDGDIDLLLGGDEFGMEAWINTGAPEWRFENVSDSYGVSDITGVIAIDVLATGSGRQMWVTRYSESGDAPELQLWNLPAGETPEKRIRWLPPYLLSHGDIDGDGDNDLIASAAVDCVPFSRELSGLYVWSNHFGTWAPRVDKTWPANGCLSVPAVSDYGGDGVPKVVYTNDYGPQHTPTSVIYPDGSIDRRLPRVYGMGIGVGDLDGDNISDYLFTNIRDDAVWLSGGGWHRGELPAGGSFGTEGYRVKWGSSFLDADNDGQLDIYVASGRLLSSSLYLNAAEQRSLFYSQGEEIGAAVGVSSETRDTTVSLADFDQDGRLDLLVGSTTDWRLLRNTSVGGNYLQVAIDDAPGTTATASCGNRVVHSEYTGARAGGQDEPLLHFGLDDCSESVDLVVRWPWGAISRREELSTNQRIQLKKQVPIRVQPATVGLGETFRITFSGNASSVVWEGQALEKISDAEWTGVFVSNETGDKQIELVIDGLPSTYRPWIRTTGEGFLRITVDPLPVRLGKEHSITVETDKSLGEASVTAIGGALERLETTPGRWQGRLVVDADSDLVSIEVARGNTPVGDPLTAAPVAALDPERTEVRVEQREDGEARVLLLPRDILGGYYLFEPENVWLETSDGAQYPFIAVGLSEWEARAPWGETLTAYVDGSPLPSIKTSSLERSRDPSAAHSQFFTLFERARAPGPDLVTLVYRPLDSEGQPIPIESEPDLVLEGLEWPKASLEACTFDDDANTCDDSSTLGRWRLESLDGTPMLITRLFTSANAEAASVSLRANPEIRTEIALHDAPIAQPSALTTAEVGPAGGLLITPRDIHGHLIGSGLEIEVMTEPESEQAVTYEGFGIYRRTGEFREAIVTIHHSEGTLSLRVTGSMPTQDNGCTFSRRPGNPARSCGAVIAYLFCIYAFRSRHTKGPSTH